MLLINAWISKKIEEKMELLWTRYRELCIKIFISRATTVYFCFKRQCYLVKSQKTIINLFYCGQWLQYKLRRYVFNLILENLLSPRYDWSKFLLGLLLPSVPTFEVSFLFVCFYGRRINTDILTCHSQVPLPVCETGLCTKLSQ